MLMSRTSRHIWIASRRKVVPPAPECPSSLSEPQYASLLFERTCQTCNATRSMNVDYAAFVRLCNNCWGARVKRGSVLAYNSGLYNDTDFMKLVFNLLPAAPYEVYKPFLPNPLAGMAAERPITQNGHMFYHESEFDNIVDGYRKLRSGLSTGSMKQFLIQHRNDTRVRLTFSKNLLEWENQTRVSRSEDLKQAKSERRTAIEEKLRDLGFNPEDFPFRNKEFDKMLDQPRSLTPRIWNNIRPKLLELLRAERERRETAAFNQAWGLRLFGVREHYRRFLDSRRDLDVWERMVFPSFDEMKNTPAMANLLFSGQATEQVSREQFASIEPEIMVDVADAIARVRSKLVKLLRVKAASAATEETSMSATRSNCKNKGKARAESHNDTGEDVEEDKALLEHLSSLFVCEHLLCKFSQAAGSPVLMSFFGVLEHQSLHSVTHGTWDDIAVAPAEPSWRARMPDLLDAIGLPQDSKLSAVREHILSGTARCKASGCENVVPGLGRGVGVLAEGALFCNMLRHVSRPTGVDATTMQPVYGRHHITFDPLPQNSPYGDMLLDPGFMLDAALPLVNAGGYIAGHDPLP
ncbi:hypothetical protein GSI_07266 [Ganoderma sinense ZZ0214-1]|uniref:Uncharacterized protein n=1 Tax=Ganoderma sinense ZZ0214-1 TaxID=1077348 RepID=A0A2G8S9X2_9APHY|nr:hypothetical protein GSI_07266 [Ganoderma sinense ZZ0214-1]